MKIIDSILGYKCNRFVVVRYGLCLRKCLHLIYANFIHDCEHHLNHSICENDTLYLLCWLYWLCCRCLRNSLALLCAIAASFNGHFMCKCDKWTGGGILIELRKDLHFLSCSYLDARYHWWWWWWWSQWHTMTMWLSWAQCKWQSWIQSLVFSKQKQYSSDNRSDCTNFLACTNLNALFAISHDFHIHIHLFDGQHIATMDHHNNYCDSELLISYWKLELFSPFDVQMEFKLIA